MNGFEEVWAKSPFGRPKPDRPAPCRPVPFERENVSGLGLWQQTITLAPGAAEADTRDREVLLEEIRVLRSIIAEIEGNQGKVADPEPGLSPGAAIARALRFG